MMTLGQIHPRVPREKQCRNCGKFGHVRKECPEKIVLKCDDCGELGYTRLTCPKCAVKNQKKVTFGEVDNKPRFSSTKISVVDYFPKDDSDTDVEEQKGNQN